MNGWNRFCRPVMVLCVICVVIAGALALTNQVTEPIIEEANHRAHEQARSMLLPEATGFTPVRNVDAPGVSEVYIADNGVGVVVTAHANGYSGPLTVMVAIKPNGVIRQIRVTEQSETKGIGSKVVDDEEFWTRFEGLPAKQLVLGEDVDGISGATMSSKALVAAVNAAANGFHTIIGAGRIMK